MYLHLVLQKIEESELTKKDEKFIKQIIGILHSLMETYSEKQLHFSIDEFKNILNITFLLLPFKEFSNVHIKTVDIITVILEAVEEQSFKEKFIDK